MSLCGPGTNFIAKRMLCGDTAETGCNLRLDEVVLDPATVVEVAARTQGAGVDVVVKSDSNRPAWSSMRT